MGPLLGPPGGPLEGTPGGPLEGTPGGPLEGPPEGPLLNESSLAFKWGPRGAPQQYPGGPLRMLRTGAGPLVLAVGITIETVGPPSKGESGGPQGPPNNSLQQSPLFSM